MIKDQVHLWVVASNTFRINIIAASGVTIIFFYKELTRNTEIRNIPVWVLINVWRRGRVMNTKFGTDVSNEMLLNAAKCQDYRFYRFWVINGKPIQGGGWLKVPPHHPPRLGLKNSYETIIYTYKRSYIHYKGKNPFFVMWRNVIINWGSFLGNDHNDQNQLLTVFILKYMYLNIITCEDKTNLYGLMNRVTLNYFG